MNAPPIPIDAIVHLKHVLFRASDQGDDRQVIEPFSVTNSPPGAHANADSIARPPPAYLAATFRSDVKRLA